jgi:hypothetical protein
MGFSVLAYAIYKVFKFAMTLITDSGTKLRQAAGVNESWGLAELNVACEVLKTYYQDTWKAHLEKK